MVNIEYQNAYTEIIEILKTLKQNELNKIPKNVLDFIYQNRNIKYEFKYCKYKTMEEQGVSILTKQIIIILFKNYFANDHQKEWIRNQEKRAFNNEENEKKEKYKVEDIFNKRNKSKELSLEPIYSNSESIADKILDFIFGKRISID